jgi:hypothetical protein
MPNYVMTRSFADCMGFKWPKDVACIVDGRRITYTELKAKKAEETRKRLRQIERPETVRHAAHVWVYYQPGLFGFCYQGTWLSLRTLKDCWTFEFRGSDYARGTTAIDIMRLFPCGILPTMDNFEIWKEAFIKRYRKPGRFKRQGMVPVWAEYEYDGGRPMRVERMEEKKPCAPAIT